MAQILSYIQVGLSILLIAGVLIQRSEAGLGAGFGSDGGGSVQYRRRGLERTIFNATIVVSVLFATACFASLFVSR